MRRASRLEIAAVLLILAAGLILRLIGLDTFIASDEIRWTCRSIGFREALRQRDWSNTFRIGHPGVVTTWLGTFFIPHDDAQARTTCQVTEDGQQLLLAGETPEEQTQRMLELGRFLFPGRVGVALFTWLCLAAIYFLVRLIWGPEMAVLSLALLALDPFFLAHSRFLHLDAVLASLMTLSVLSLLAARQRSRTSRWRLALLVVSGAMGGLAILQKSPAAFLVPFTALLLAADIIRRGVNRKLLVRSVCDLAIWGFVAGVVYVTLWPAMWSNSIGTIQQVMDKAVGYAEEGHSLGSYFLGHPVHDPGWLFYPVAASFRLSPLVLVGFAAGLVWLVKGERHKRWLGLGVLLIYSVLFGAFMSIGAKKFDRYLLPIFPALDIVAAFGLLGIASAIQTRMQPRSRYRRLSLALLCVAALIVQAVLLLPNYPYYLTYYNPLLGGLRRASTTLLVGWGEGYEEVAAYLNAKPDANRLQVAVSSVSLFAPLFEGEAKGMSRYSVSQTDYVVFYISYVQRLHHQDLLEVYFLNRQVEPEYVVKLRGVEYIWVYPNTYHIQPMSYIDENSQVGQECLLANGDTLFARHYGGDLPLYEFYTHWNLEEMGEFLDNLPAECERIWYARYPEADGRFVDLVEKQSLQLLQETFPYMEVNLYRLIEPEIDLLSQDVRFGGLQLRGYGVTNPAPAWGQDGGVFLAWEALQALDEDYTTFVHVYDSHGNRVAQEDRLITDAYLRPTSEWNPGQSGLTFHHLSIPPGTPPGRYTMEVGVYLRETGKRLPLLDSPGEEPGTAVKLEMQIGVSQEMPKAIDLGIPYSLEQNIVSRIRLLGYCLEKDALLAGSPVTLRLFWEALGEMREAYRLEIGLRGADGRVYGQRGFELVSTDYPTDRWRVGEILQESYGLTTDERMPTGEAVVELNLLGEAGRPLLTEPVEVTRVWVQSTQPSFEIPDHIEEQLGVNLGDQVTLLGYDLDSGPVKPGEDVRVTVYWRAQREMDVSYKVFVHLYDEDGSIVGQQDRVPGLGARPTVDWEVGEVLADRYSVPLPPDVPAGTYRLAVGMYDEGTGERMATYGPGGARLDQDRILLGLIEVEP